MNKKQESFLERVDADLSTRGFPPSSILDLAQSLAVPPQAVKAILEIGTSHGVIVSLGSDLFYGRKQLRQIASGLKDQAPPDGFDGAGFRALTGLSRRLADLLTFQLERLGYLERREGRLRFLNEPQAENPGEGYI